MSDLPPAGRFEGREHVLPVRVYYEDTDVTGVVYHATYLRYLERGRTEFLRSIGIHHAELLAGDAPTAFVVTEMTVRWLRPARVDDALTVRTAYDAVRGARMTGTQSILRGEQVLVEAEVDAACVSPGGGARRPPPGLVAAVRPYLEA